MDRLNKWIVIRNLGWAEKQRLKASTIVETLMAIVLISIAFGVGMLVYLNTMSNIPIVREQQVNIALQEVARLTQKEERYINETITHKKFIIERKVKPYPMNRDVYHLHLLAYDTDETIIGEHQELIYIPKN